MTKESVMKKHPSMVSFMTMCFVGLAVAISVKLAAIAILHKFIDGQGIGMTLVVLAIALAVICIPAYLFMEADRIKNEREWDERVAREKAKIEKEKANTELAYG